MLSLFESAPRVVQSRGAPVMEPRPGMRRFCGGWHSLASQALAFSGCYVQFLSAQGQKPGSRSRGTRFCAPDVRSGFLSGVQKGTGAAAPEIFWVLLYLYKSTSPGGETSPRPNSRSARRRKLQMGGHMGPPLRFLKLLCVSARWGHRALHSCDDSKGQNFALLNYKLKFISPAGTGSYHLRSWKRSTAPPQRRCRAPPHSS